MERIAFYFQDFQVLLIFLNGKTMKNMLITVYCLFKTFFFMYLQALY